MLVLANAVLTLALVEVLAVAGYWYRTGALYYTDRPHRDAVPEQPEGVAGEYRIHPYLGFILSPSPGSRTGTDDARRANNYGFESVQDYPYIRRTPDELLVGVFGGSVAAKLTHFEATERILARHLAEPLGITPADVTVLNFAQGGFKQPQQLLTLVYFSALGQQLDLVVNLDGFNDVVLAGRNLEGGVATDMPSLDHMRALQDVTPMTTTTEGLEHILRIRAAWTRYARIHNRAWSRQGWELRLASGFLVDWLLYRHHHHRYFEQRLAYGAAHTPTGGDSWLYLNTVEPAADAAVDDSSLRPTIRLWGHASELMHRSAQDAGAAYLHVVQPNQYYRTARQYGTAEEAVAFAAQSPYPELVERGYPLLEKAVLRLRAGGVAAHGLFTLFDDVTEPVYADDCCHYTDAGQRVLAEAIGELAVRTLAGEDVRR